MLDKRSLIAFDIETIPDPDIGRRIMAIEGDDNAVVLEMVRRRLEEKGGASKYPQQPWHRIVCACVTTLDPESGAIEMRALGGEAADERAIVAAFFDLFPTSGHRPRIISWNGGGFDLPVLRYRAMKHGIAAPGFHRTDRERSYQNRRDDLHIDLMDVLSSYGASPRAGLGTTCDLLGLPSKRFLDGEVYEHFLAGEQQRVVEYCKLDTLETLLVFLNWSVHSGTLSRTDLAAHLTTIRALVATQEYPAWSGVGELLASWPSWLERAT
jgi:3'-5' exonuclease